MNYVFTSMIILLALSNLEIKNRPSNFAVQALAAATTNIVLIDSEGRKFDYEENKPIFRNIPSAMCSASAISASNSANQVAFVSAHKSLRSKLNNCAWKVPKPSPPLPATISSTAIVALVDNYTQSMKNSQGCSLISSSQAQRIHSFKLDNGSQVTNGYIGENLYWRSVCLSVGDTTNFNKYQAKNCAPGQLYQDAANAWWNQISIYSDANNGSFLTQAQLNRHPSVRSWTQTAWANTTVVAAAAAECSTTSNLTFTCSPPGYGGCSAAGAIIVKARCYSWIVAGWYYKGGNVNTQDPYTSDGTICNPNCG